MCKGKREYYKDAFLSALLTPSMGYWIPAVEIPSPKKGISITAALYTPIEISCGIARVNRFGLSGSQTASTL